MDNYSNGTFSPDSPIVWSSDVWEEKMFLLLVGFVVIILSMAEVVFVGVYWEYQRLGN